MNIFFAQAQIFSTRGTDFWVGYGAHTSMYNADGSVNVTGGSQQMVLYFASAKSALITVQIPATGWTKSYKLNGGVVESDVIPKFGIDDARLAREGVSNNGIHITSDQPVAAYCHIYDIGSSGASLLFPTNTLGQDYYTLNFTQNADNKNAHSYCFVIATDDSTLVEVTPSANTLNHPAGVPFTQMLQKGQVLNLLGAQTGFNGISYSGVDLTGTRIRTAINGNTSCKKIAVFCGSSGVNVRCDSSGTITSDNMIQQMFPYAAWGQKFVTVPTKKMPDNIFRIMVKDTATNVTQNGTKLRNLINGRYYEIQCDTPSVIQSSQPVLVAQYITTANQCNDTINGNDGDPEIIYVSPVSLAFGNVAINSLSHSNITSNYANVIMKTVDTSSFLLDGQNKPGSFKLLLYDTSFSYAQFTVNAGSHALSCDSQFIVTAYGYGNFESYGYNTGGNIQNRNNNLTIQNPYATPDSLQTCRATPFRIAISLPYRATNLQWDFGNNPFLSPNNYITNNNPLPDSIYVEDGRTLYLYKIPGYFTYSSLDSFPINVNAYFPTQDGCIDFLQYNYYVQIFEKPLAQFNLKNNPCLNDSLHFFDSSTGFGRNFIKWYWNFGDGNTSGLRNPVQQYKTYGNYNINLKAVTDMGCFGDTTQPVTISTPPVANFNITGIDCIGNSTAFTDLSTEVFGTIVKWNWDFGDSTNSIDKNPFKQYNKPDTFNIKLLVANEQNCADSISKQWIMYSYPKVIMPTNLYVIEGNSIQIKPDYQGAPLTYLWSPFLYLTSDTTAYPIATPFTGIFYHEIVTGNGGCAVTGDVYIDVIKFLEIPNAFSPNGDGINDTWIIKNIERYPQCAVQVFNRYGQILFNSSGYYKPWDGRYNGKPLPVGTYYFIINTKNKFLPVKSGYVTILR
ncbi:MAG: gliding motility-associated C-terminal domain-containing protein [Chitinophagaceae bacterium]